MALVKGVNAGFLLAGISPTVDPSESNWFFDEKAIAIKDTAPVGATKVTEIGWFTGSTSEEANFEVGIYDHNAGDDNPEAKVGDFSTTNAKGTGSGWKKVTGLNIPITEGTIYWIAVQLDNTSSTTSVDSRTDAGEKADTLDPVTSLPTPWGASESTTERLMAFYAVTDASVEATDNMTIIGENIY